MHHTRHHRLHKPSDKARSRCLFLEFGDVCLDGLQRRRTRSAFLVDLLNEMRVGQRAPFAIHPQPLDFHVAEGKARHALEIIDLVVILAVRAEPHKAHGLWLGKFQ